MIILASTSDKVQIVSSSTSALDVHASWLDNASGTISVSRQNTAITTATTTDVVAAPGSGTLRNLRTLTVRNKGGSSNDVTVRHTDGTTTVELYKTTLVAGAQLQYNDEAGFS